MDESKKQAKDKRALIKRSARTVYKFYLIKPEENGDADDLAEKLISIKNVEEVFVTDGDYGFVVKTRFVDNKNDEIYDYLSKRLGSNFGNATSYYQYKK